MKTVIFPIKEVKEKSLTSFFMKKCHIYDNVIVIYSERSKKTEYQEGVHGGEHMKKG